MKQNKIRTAVSVVLLTICLGGCQQNSSPLKNGTSVNQVLSEQMAKADGKNNIDNNDMPQADDTQQANDNQTTIQEIEIIDDTTQEGPYLQQDDYDLTQMGSDMVYATLYQILLDQEGSEGKKLKLDGYYCASYYEETGEYYHYIIVKDAAACCAIGVQFVWEDGTHIYPDEYPKDETPIEVEGTIETYTQEGDNNIYTRLKNATMKVIG